MVTPITRPGQTNGAGADDAQFLRLFSNEVLTAFHQKNKLMPFGRVRTLTNGKSATFPVTGTAGTAYHEVGESVFGTDDGGATRPYLSAILSKEREIHVDDELLSGTFVPSIDHLKNHWDERSIYVNEIATALADKADNNIARTLFAAALADPDDTGFSSMAAADKVNTSYTDATVGASVAGFAFDTAQLFDENNIPEDGRILLVRPSQYYALAAETDLVNRDWGGAGNGSYPDAQILKVAGFTIIMSNSLPNSDEETGVGTSMDGVRNDPFGTGAGYAAPAAAASVATQLGAIAFQTEAIGSVKMKELSTESEYFMERRGHLLLSSYMMGHDVLRAECAAWMKVTAGNI